MPKNDEKIFSTIVLKYYKAPKKNDTSIPSFKCAWCLKFSNRTGGGFYDKDGNINQICEDCGVQRYKEENKFKTLAAARARRRRIFDVGYLFNEAILDVYMSDRGIVNFKDCELADEIFINAGQLYNVLFSKEEKLKLETTELQKDIEFEINKSLFTIDFEKFFANI